MFGSYTDPAWPSLINIPPGRSAGLPLPIKPPRLPSGLTIESQQLELIVFPLVVVRPAFLVFGAAIGHQQAALQLVHCALIFMPAFSLRQRQA
jgi:hypothetical protein